MKRYLTFVSECEHCGQPYGQRVDIGEVIEAEWPDDETVSWPQRCPRCKRKLMCTFLVGDVRAAWNKSVMLDHVDRPNSDKNTMLQLAILAKLMGSEQP